MTLTVIRADEAHAQVIAALMEAAFPADTGERWPAADLMTVLSLPGSQAWLACSPESGLSPVGFALVREVIDEAELLLIAVSPDLRGKGFAKSLLGAIKTDLMSRNIEILHLEVRETNQAALGLYTSAGFDVVGRRRNYYRGADGKLSDALTLQLQIKATQVSSSKT
jgi:[ribosomal protein S18]-alanine N-acetyltransferase